MHCLSAQIANSFLFAALFDSTRCIALIYAIAKLVMGPKSKLFGSPAPRREVKPPHGFYVAFWYTPTIIVPVLKRLLSFGMVLACKLI